MKSFCPILTLTLVLVTTLLVSCGGPNTETKPPTYTSEKISEIQTYITPVNIARDQMTELENLIEKGDWVDVDSLIHGRLGQLRSDMSYVSRKLLPRDQEQAQQLAKKVFQDLERIDVAAKEKDSRKAQKNYNQALQDFDAFLELVPEESESETASA